jgi:hypothetical protein
LLDGRRGAETVPRDASFDDLVSASEDRLRDRQTECLGGLEIDNQLELGRFLDREIGGLGAFEDPDGPAMWRTANGYDRVRRVGNRRRGTNGDPDREWPDTTPPRGSLR